MGAPEAGGRWDAGVSEVVAEVARPSNGQYRVEASITRRKLERGRQRVVVGQLERPISGGGVTRAARCMCPASQNRGTRAQTAAGGDDQRVTERGPGARWTSETAQIYLLFAGLILLAGAALGTILGLVLRPGAGGLVGGLLALAAFTMAAEDGSAEPWPIACNHPRKAS